MRSLFKTWPLSWAVFLPLGIALTSGIFMGLAAAPVAAWPLAWVALAPLWILLVETSQKQETFALVPRHAAGSALVALVPRLSLGTRFGRLRRLSANSKFLRGLAWGIGYHGTALFWITGIHPMTWMGVPWLASLAIAIFCWVFITLWGAALVAIWATFLFWIFSPRSQAPPGNEHLSKVSGLIRVIIGTALWCGLEALWSAGPLWWTSVSYTQSPDNLAILHLGKISGPSAVTAAIVAVNGLIAEAWMNRKDAEIAKDQKLFSALLPLLRLNNKYLRLAVGVLVSLHLAGFALYSRPLTQQPADALKVGIIQGNIPNEIKLYSEGGRRAIEGYTTGYKTLAEKGVDAVLTPETALPFVWAKENLQYSSLYQAILDKGVLVWVGGFGRKGLSFTNSLFTVTGTGEVFSRYDKSKLVPLGEYIPFEEFLGGLINRLSPLDAHLAAGSAKQLLDTPFGRAIVGICYESAFAEHFRRQAASGGQFILTASNNAHYSPSMPAQHHAQDVMRAIETDRWAVRATNTGYSGIVDPHGRTLWMSGINTYEIHAATIYRRLSQTLYVRWGDWLTPVLLAVAGIFGLSNTFWKGNKSQTPGRETR
jgi:apolipoprotein N-acyltransferase